jgi:polar amino acid transport system ATP-binding protein
VSRQKEIVIKIEDLSKKYNEHYALQDIHLKVIRNQIISIVGPSGGGKSTLLRCINYLEEPTYGKIFINDKLLTKKNQRKLCLKIGMVFQNFNLFPHMNVLDNLIYAPTKVLGQEHNTLLLKAEGILDNLGLTAKLQAYPADLSGGQKQRVAIARSLMMDPEIMLFDEPTSALDVELMHEVIEVIKSLKNRLTIIIITHDLRFAKIISDRLIFLEHGKILADQPCKEFFSIPKSPRVKQFLQNSLEYGNPELVSGSQRP